MFQLMIRVGDMPKEHFFSIYAPIKSRPVILLAMLLMLLMLVLFMTERLNLCVILGQKWGHQHPRA